MVVSVWPYMLGHCVVVYSSHLLCWSLAWDAPAPRFARCDKVESEWNADTFIVTSDSTSSLSLRQHCNAPTALFPTTLCGTLHLQPSRVTAMASIFFRSYILLGLPLSWWKSSVEQNVPQPYLVCLLPMCHR